MEFFADRNLGTRTFPSVLRDAGVTVHLHQDHFAQDAPDHVWVPEVARRGWPIISPDKAIAREPLVVAAVMTSGAAMFCLSGGHWTADAQARNVLRCPPSILRLLEKQERPFIARVYHPNPNDPADRATTRVQVKLTLAQWIERNAPGR